MKKKLTTTAIVLAVMLLAFGGFVAYAEMGEKGGGEAKEKMSMAQQAKITIDQAMKAATDKVKGKVIEAEYVFPYLAHAPMEALDGVLSWDGERAVARLGSGISLPIRGFRILSSIRRAVVVKTRPRACGARLQPAREEGFLSARVAR